MSTFIRYKGLPLSIPLLHKTSFISPPPPLLKAKIYKPQIFLQPIRVSNVKSEIQN